jgi:predicted metal-binding protein
MAGTTLTVCTTCKAGQPEGDGPRPGARLHAALAADPPPGVAVRGVECLSACEKGCALALSGPGKWAYVYGFLDPDVHLAEIRAGAAAYALAPDGIVPWRDRPVIFRKQSLARVPPLEPKGLETTDVA